MHNASGTRDSQASESPCNLENMPCGWAAITLARREARPQPIWWGKKNSLRFISLSDKRQSPPEEKAEGFRKGLLWVRRASLNGWNQTHATMLIYRSRRVLQACAHPRRSLCRRSEKLLAWWENVRTSRHVAVQGREFTLLGFSFLCFVSNDYCTRWVVILVAVQIRIPTEGFGTRGARRFRFGASTDGAGAWWYISNTFTPFLAAED